MHACIFYLIFKHIFYWFTFGDMFCIMPLTVSTKDVLERFVP